MVIIGNGAGHILSVAGAFRKKRLLTAFQYD